MWASISRRPPRRAPIPRSGCPFLARPLTRVFPTSYCHVDNAVFGELRRQLSEAEIVELGVSTANFVGFGRFNAILGIDPV